MKSHRLKNNSIEPTEEYKDIIENAPDVICRVDKMLCLTYINPIIKELIGIEQHNLIGKPIASLTFGGENYTAIWLENLQKVFAAKQKLFFKAPCIYKGNTYYFQVYMSPALDSNGLVESVICVSRNITEQKQFDAELARLDRLNLVGKIAASIGHEVRNPLTTVRGFLQMLDKREKTNKNHEYYQMMIGELDRANALLSEFLTLAKDKPLLLKPANLNSIITSIYPLLKADARANNKDLTLKLDTIDNILLDEKEIRQLIFNIVQNGIEASPPNSIVTIRTFMNKKNVVLAIEDFGTGIPQPILEKLGTPFLTTKENGTGLGLAVCYKIAKNHNAVISPSTGANGSTFYVKFEKCSL
ncbi:MAG: PAS domain-containing protein [Pelosinus sp.]|nr:PAS domain-containing protein [Pelosinus sp.]